MNGTAFNIAMVLRADVAPAKAGLSDVATSLRTVSAEAGKTSTATKKQALELEQMAVAAAKAAQSQQDLALAERRALESRSRAVSFVGPVANPATNAFTATFRATETAASSLRGAVAGLNVTIGSQAQDMIEAARSSAVYQSALDDVRASFNPLFAASRQYEQHLDRIAEAERLGAISAREAADARQRAATIIAPAGMPAHRPGSGNDGMNTAYFAAQANDVAMMAALGQNPMTLALQQGPQISQQLNAMGGGVGAVKALGAGILSMINPLSLATIGIIGLGAAGVQWLGSLKGETKTAKKALADLAESVDRVGKSNDAARRSVASLAEEYGSAAAEAKILLQTLADLDRRQAGRDASTAISSLYDEMTGGSGLGLRSESDRFGSLQRLFGEASWLTSGRVSETGSPQTFQVMEAMKASTVAGKSGDLDAQIEAVSQLLDVSQQAANAFGGMSKEEEAWIKTVAEELKELQKLRAEDENAAGKAKAGETARDLERRAELERTILQYGAQSAQTRAVENRQEREGLALRLEGLGITRKDEEGRAAVAALNKLQGARDAAALDDQRQMLRDQDDRIASLRLELSLIGASKDEQARIKALAEAEVEIRDRNLGLLDGMLARFKAITAAEAENRLAREKALQDLKVGAMGDAFDVQIGLARDPVSRANLEAQKEYARLVAEGEDADLAAGHAAQIRARAINETIDGARSQIADMGDELMARQRIAAQVATGTVSSTEANRLLREELELRPLIAAAARAEGAEKQQLLDTISGLRIAQEALAAEDRRLAQNDYLKAQAERIQQLRIELALVGESAASRARILALAKAEQDIHRLGMEGAAAEDVRRQARTEAELAQTIEAQADAWKRVQSAGEAAIDGVLDKLREGDVGGALSDFLGEIEKGFFDLSVRNPLKNALFGTNLGTMADAGGMQGIWDRLTGKTKADEQGILGMATAPVQSMTIAATSVILNAGSLSGLAGLAANANISPGLTGGTVPTGGMIGGLSGSTDVQSQVWSFFAGKGLAAHQIAGIMGNISAESAFNPLAVGDAGEAYGMFQHNDRKGKLFDFIGGKGNLGDVQKQLEFAWHELMTSESGPMRRLLGSTDVRGATEAFVGFERPQGYSLANPSGAMHFDHRLEAAQEALTTFTNATHTAETDLGSLGKGFDVFGSALSGLAQGGPEGAVQGLLGSIGTAIAGALNIPGFASGGDHGGGWRVVGENGPELEATGPSRIFNASQTRSILTSRAPLMAANTAAPIDTRPVIQIVNNSSAPVVGKVEETTDARGQRQFKMVMSDMTADGLTASGGRGARAMRDVYGMAPGPRRRE